MASSPEALKGVTRQAFIAKTHGEHRAAEYLVGSGPLAWLVDLAHDAGLPKVEYTMNGSRAVGLRWPDIVAWIEGSQRHDVHAGWRRDVMLLSQAHANMANAAIEFKCEVPFQPE